MNKDKSIMLVVIVILVLVITTVVLLNKNSVDDEITSMDDMNIDTNVTTEINEDVDWDSYEIQALTLQGNVVTISQSGVYRISGNGQGIIVDAKDQNVKLILDGVTINSINSPCLWIKKSNLTVISLEKGTVNTLEDSGSYVIDSDNEPDGVVFSKDDLVIEGEGTLKITSHYSDGIVSKDHLKINQGIFEIDSNDDGIRGTDSVVITGGVFNITANNDGIKSTNTTNDSLGYVVIEDGTFTITAGCDGIQASTNLIIKNGAFELETGGGSTNASTQSNWGMWNSNESDNSAKGLKASNDLALLNGTFTINSSDDAIHSNHYIAISNGTYHISSGDDGIHADHTLVIENGSITIETSYEGIEASNITINNGEISIVASDDGINIAGGVDASGMNRPGGNEFSVDSNQKLIIDGGNIFVDAKGDGLDANGSVYINNGTVIINGPTDSANGALDYDGAFVVKSGLVIATGTSGMAQTPSDSSDLYTISIQFSTMQSANTIVSIRDDNDHEIITYAPTKTFSSVIVTSDLLSSGSTYYVYTGGSSTGTIANGLYENGSYTKGDLLGTVTLSSKITTIGSGNSMSQMPGNHGGGRR